MNKILLWLVGQILSLLAQVFVVRWLGIHLPSTYKVIAACGGFTIVGAGALLLARWTRRPLLIHPLGELLFRVAIWVGLLGSAVVEAKFHSAMFGGALFGIFAITGGPALHGHVRDALWVVPRVRLLPRTGRYAR